MTDLADDPVAVIDNEIAAEPAQAALELPDYHGRKPVGMKTAFSGAGTRVTRPHSIGDRLVLVVEVKVKKAGHEETDDGLIYGESHKVLDMFELPKEQGSRLISTVRSLYRTADDAVKGRAQVPELGDVGYTDASGVVLTPAEVAALRGDPIRAILSPDLTPVVVVYSDGERELWPDDFSVDMARPRVGETFEDSHGNLVTVARLLNHETGEEVDAAPSIDGGAAVSPTTAGDVWDGDLGDTAGDAWETPDPRTPEQIAEDLATQQIEATLPTSVDFSLVDCDLAELKIVAAKVTDLAEAHRLVKAEQQGRGRALKPRKGAIDILGARIIELEKAAG